MAFVAAGGPGIWVKGDPTTRPGKLTAEYLAGNGGEPAIAEGDDGFERASLEAYRHRAYPAAEVRMSDTLNAQNAWTKIKSKSPKGE